MIDNHAVNFYMMTDTLVTEDASKRHTQIINENVASTPIGKLYTLTYDTILTEFAKKNWNGRTYSKEVFMIALDKNALFQSDLTNNGGVGSEMGHPSISKGTNELARQMTIDPKLVCAVLKKYWIDPNDSNVLIGRFTTVSGGYGDMLRDRILTGLPAMVSSRSVGGVDARGNVLPGLIVVCWDHVHRPSAARAKMITGSEHVNTFDIPTPPGNTMSESAVAIDIKGEQLRNFLMSEAVSRDRINQICDVMKLDYDTMAINENSVTLERFDENSHTKIVMPLNKLIGANMARLWA